MEKELHQFLKEIDTFTEQKNVPILEPERIPVISQEYPVKNLDLKIDDRDLRFTCVSMGNPHAITIVEDTEKFDVKKYGEELEVDKTFI